VCALEIGIPKTHHSYCKHQTKAILNALFAEKTAGICNAPQQARAIDLPSQKKKTSR